MLQDAIWADTERLESDEDYQDTTVKFLKAVIKGWIYAAENPQEASDITIAAGSGWGPSHELWMVNETNKLIWPSPDGIGVIDEAAWDKTVEMARSRPSTSRAAHLITEEPPATAWTNDWIQTGARRARGRRTSTSPARTSSPSTSPSRRAATSRPDAAWPARPGRPRGIRHRTTATHVARERKAPKP